MKYLRAFSFVTLVQDITCRIAVDDELIKCVRGVVVFSNGGHGKLECVQRIVSEIVRETTAMTCQTPFTSTRRLTKCLPVIVCTCLAVGPKREVCHVCSCLACLRPFIAVTAKKGVVSFGQ